MKITAETVENHLIELSNPEIAMKTQKFFKTGKGEYGEGDQFIGIRVPVIRKQLIKYKDISLHENEKLLKNTYHEVRMFALLMLVDKFSRGNEQEKFKIYQLYTSNLRYVNNWDLVDCSAHYIVGAFLADKDKQPLYDLAVSEVLWERRVSIISTFYLIKNNEFNETLKISRMLINDREDLIHKAVGWMLREIGNRSQETEEKFLKENAVNMPRTMLRYAIEKFPKEKRKFYLECK